MKKQYSIETLRKLYRVDNKYWQTGDVDYLLARIELAKRIDERFWSEICAIVSVATRKHLPVQAAVDALKLLGYEEVEDGEQG